MEEFYDDTFLAKWIAGDLSSEELKKFKASKYYQDYKKIKEGSQALEAPSFDLDTSLQKLREKVYDKKNFEKGKTAVSLFPKWLYGAAAILIIGLSLFFYNNGDDVTSYKTDYGEHLTIVLPDNSKVNLNAKSKLSYINKDWQENRVITFNGEAFFDVEKGASFEVKSNQGVVKVLGTEFNVISRQNYFEVKCLEGKVQVTNSQGSNDIILLPGKAVRYANTTLEKWDFTENKPSWLQGESIFKETPLFEVITALQNQYNVVFEVSEIDLNKRYTGGFTHNNIKIALQTVFEPMNISYSQTGKNTILLNSK